MKVVILAGGAGTRLSEETGIKPKPLVEIGGYPIIWHIMKLYSHHGLNEFVICLGYKGYLIKEYFANYALHMSDVTIDIGRDSLQVHDNKAEPWRITLVDTGNETATGGRIKRIAAHLGDSPFCMTYGDGVGNIDIGALLAFHRRHGRLATVTATHPPARFGALRLEGTRVQSFQEKPVGEGGYINGGFFVLSKEVIDYIDGDTTTWEEQPMKRLVAAGQLEAYKHQGFWHPMDTLRDKRFLEGLWETGQAPWKVW